MYKTQDIFLSTANTNCKGMTHDRRHISEACARYEAVVTLQTGLKKGIFKFYIAMVNYADTNRFGAPYWKIQGALTCFASI